MNEERSAKLQIAKHLAKALVAHAITRAIPPPEAEGPAVSVRSGDMLGPNADMPKERKIMIAAGAGCVLTACAGLLAASIAVAVGELAWAIPAVTLACLAFWIGNAIACTLKENPHPPKP